MTTTQEFTNYDDLLTSILVNEKSILGFLSAIFNFLARRTDFYHVPEGPYENVGFPSGVAEELVIKVLRTCDPKNLKAPNGARKPADINNEIMCSTVAQEVEVVTDDDEDIPETPPQGPTDSTNTSGDSPPIIDVKKNDPDRKDTVQSVSQLNSDDYAAPVIPTQNPETYNGAEREKYWWSQTIMELDVTVKLPPGIKSSKDLKVTINPTEIYVGRKNGDVVIKDSLPYKIKAIDSFWSVSEGKLLMHLEKVQERWWNKLLNSEEAIDLSKIDASRPLDELPEDHVAKVRELQWNQERKIKGLPTSDDIRNMDILKKAWNAPGSPFIGQEFDPSVIGNTTQIFSTLPGQK